MKTETIPRRLKSEGTPPDSEMNKNKLKNTDSASLNRPNAATISANTAILARLWHWRHCYKESGQHCPGAQFSTSTGKPAF
jgi:hypothetical protein